MADEPSAAGTPLSSNGGNGNGGSQSRSIPVSTSFDLKMPGLDVAAKGMAQVNIELERLRKGLRDMSSTQYLLSQGINAMLESIEKRATSTTAALQGVTTAIGGVGQGGRGGNGGIAPPTPPAAPSGGGRGGGGGTSYVTNMAASAAAGLTAAGAGGGGGAGGAGGGGFAAAGGASGAGGIGGSLGGGLMGGGGDILSAIPGVGTISSLAMLPMRFIRDRVQENRQVALAASGELSAQAFATGNSNDQGLSNMIGGLARMPGTANAPVMGTESDILSVMGTARAVGGQFGVGGAPNGPRAGGFFQGLSQMQEMTPGNSPAQMANVLGAQVSNVRSQQSSAFLTGGAFSMVGSGGRMKSVQEWAESILRWLEGQRPGKDRGKPFTYGEMLAQHFPGSNIDAWLDATGISPDMKEYFWTYAEGKATKTGSTQGVFDITAPSGNLAWERMRSQSEVTKGSFSLAGQMTGQYSNREQMNKYFNQLMSQIMAKVIPAITKSGPLSAISKLPDFIEELIFSFIEGSGPIGQTIAGAAFNASAVAGGAASGLASILGVGDMPEPGNSGIGDDVGDIGDYGTMGGTTTAGLHPDVRKRVDAMMQANPKLKMTSGLRDHTTQQRLAKRGFSRVSGKPSAHTRGMAADLGPRSQYAWIANNAKKFGLSNGAKFGEPWHVGMGDVGDVGSDTGIGDGILGTGIGPNFGPDLSPSNLLSNLPGAGIISDVTDGLSKLFNLLKDVGAFFSAFVDSVTQPLNVLSKLIPDLTGSAADALTKGIPDVLSTLLGNFGSSAAGAADPRVAFDPNTAAGLPTSFSVTQNITRGQGFGSGIFGLGASSSSNNNGPAAPLGGSTGSGRGASGDQVARAAYNAGFRGDNLIKAVAIAEAESGFNPSAQGDIGLENATWGPSVGLWQIRSLKAQSGTGQPRDATRLMDPAFNASSAFGIAGGGTNFHPWSTFTSGAYLKFMTEARNDAHLAGVGDIPDISAMKAYNYTPSAPIDLNHGDMIFHNTFQITGASNNSGPGGNTLLDVRKTVTQLADALEVEMKRRKHRTN